MKYVMIIIDGVSDDPIKELGNKTPLDVAFAPNIHYIATKGEVGKIKTAYEGFPVESMVCIMGLLGYEPKKYYPSGRSSFEAMAQGIHINDDDLVFRCNIVSTDKEQKSIDDFTAGLITDTDAKKFISKIKMPHDNWELYAGQSYRNTLIIRHAGVNPSNVVCFPPHMHIGEDIKELKPYLKTDQQNELMKDVWSFLNNSYRDNKMLWVWSPSNSINWPSFKQITGLNGAVVCGMDFLRGIAMAADMDFDVIPGTTGYIDTNYKAKGEYAKEYLKNHDFVLVHINATDEEAHQHNFKGKINAIEKVDNLIVGPIMNELHNKYEDDFRIVVCGDHKTRCSDGKHIGDPVPYAMYGKGVKQVNNDGLNEISSYNKDEYNSIDFIVNKFKVKI